MLKMSHIVMVVGKKDVFNEEKISLIFLRNSKVEKRIYGIVVV